MSGLINISHRGPVGRLALAVATALAGMTAWQVPIATALPDQGTTNDANWGAEGNVDALVADPNGQFVLASAQQRDAVAGVTRGLLVKIDASTGARVATLETTWVPLAVMVAADGNSAIIGFDEDNATSLWVVDTGTMTKTGEITSLDGMTIGGNLNWRTTVATMHDGDAYLGLREVNSQVASRKSRIVRVDLDDDPNDPSDYLTAVTVAESTVRGTTILALDVNSSEENLVAVSATSTARNGLLEVFDLTNANPAENTVSERVMGSLTTDWFSCARARDCAGDLVMVDDGKLDAVGTTRFDIFVATSKTGTGTIWPGGVTVGFWNGSSSTPVTGFAVTSANTASGFSSLETDGTHLFIGSNINPGQITRLALDSVSYNSGTNTVTIGATSTLTFDQGQDVRDSRIRSMAMTGGVIFAGTDGTPFKVMRVPTANWPATDTEAPKPTAMIGDSRLDRAVDIEPSTDGEHLYVLLNSSPVVLQRIDVDTQSIDATARLADLSSLGNGQFSIAYDHDASRAYIDLGSDPLALAVVDLDTMTVVDTITDDAATFAGALVVRTVTNELLVLLDESGGVIVLARFDLATGDRLADRATLSNVTYADASAMSLDAAQSAMFLAEANVIERIDLETVNSTTSTTVTETTANDVLIGSFVDAVPSPDGEHVYFLAAVADWELSVVEVDTDDVTARRMVQLTDDHEAFDSSRLAISPDATMLYALTYDAIDTRLNARVVVVDIDVMSRVDAIDLMGGVGNDFSAIAMSPDGATGYAASHSGFVESFSSRTSWDTTAIGGFDALSDGATISASHVACTEPGQCLAAGTYSDVNGVVQVFIARSHDGEWTHAEPIPALIAVNDGPGGAVVVDLDCDAIETCVVVGNYSTNYADSQVARSGAPRTLSFALAISIDPASSAFEMGSAAFVDFQTGATDPWDVPNSSTVIGVSCNGSTTGVCAVVGELEMLLPPDETDPDSVTQDMLSAPLSYAVGTSGIVEGFVWQGAHPTTEVSDLACNIAPTHCVAVGRYQPDATNEPNVFEITLVVLQNGTSRFSTAPAVMALTGHDNLPDDLVVSCPTASTSPQSTLVSCKLAGSYNDISGNDRTPFTADVALPSTNSSNDAITNVEGHDVYDDLQHPDVPSGLMCITMNSCVMAHDTDGAQPSQIWEFGTGTAVEFDWQGFGRQRNSFMSDWSMNPANWSDSGTSDLHCAAITHCVAVGWFEINGDDALPYLLTKHGNTWGYAERVPGVPYPGIGASPSVQARIASVACPGVDACVAVGGVESNHSHSARAIIVQQHSATVISPTPPRSVAATVSGDSVTVTWGPPAAGTDSPVTYTVTLSGAAGTSTCSVGSPATRCTITDLNPGDYVATVTAANRFGTSWEGRGAEATVAGVGVQVPAPPADGTVPTSTPLATEPATTAPATTAPTTTAPATTAPMSTLAVPSLGEVLALPEAVLMSSPSVVVGGSVELTVGGFVPGVTVRLVVASEPQVLGSGVAGADGSVTVSGVIPVDLSPGEHTLAVIDENGFGFRQTITVSGAVLPATGGGVPAMPVVPLLLVVFGVLAMAGTRRRAMQ